MRKIIMILLVSVFLITGCGNNDLEVAFKKVSNYLNREDTDKSYVNSFYLDEENSVIVVFLKDKDMKDDFLKNVKVQEKFFKFIEEDTTKLDFYISKLINYNNIRFNEYYKSDNINIYLSGNVDEFYVIDTGQVRTLKDYITGINQTVDRSIKGITDNLVKKDVFDDGGTTIYKSEEKDISMVVCNTIVGNKDVYIGDYKMDYEQDMCN